MTNRTRTTQMAVSLFALVALCMAQTSLATPPPRIDPSFAQTPSVTRDLTPSERRGKAFYLRGESASGQEITALVGEIDVPASTVTCAGCHGARGEGNTEGGVTAGNLTWSFLTKPYGHVDGNRKHPAFTENSFVRAMTAGIDPSGTKLSVAMPIYRLSQTDMADLIAYLKRIEGDRDPGLTDAKIVLGTILPGKGALVEMGQAMREILQAYFDDINNRGGIYNRQIELRVATSEGDPSSIVTQAKHLIDKENVFAIVSGLTAGADESISSVTKEMEVPIIGPSTLVPHRGLPLNRYLFYLLPGVQDQAGALMNFAARRIDKKNNRIAIISSDAPLSKTIAAIVEKRGMKLGLTVTANYYPANRFNSTEQLGRLAQQGIEHVFFLGSDADLKQLVSESEAVSWNPTIYGLGVLIGRDIQALPPRMKDRIFLAFPTVPTDVSSAGASKYGALITANKLRPQHTAARLSALAAATIVVEALQRAGKDVSRERFVISLEGLYDFDTGLTPRITFGPNRRIGAFGAYIVTLDPDKGLVPATVEWIPTD